MIWNKLFTAVAIMGISTGLCAEEGEPTLSRQMKLGIRFYEQRDDAQAMDRFMEVLTRGDPNERPLANEYINLITHRMNTGEKLPMPPKPRAAAPARPAAPPVVEEEEEAQPLEKAQKAPVKAPEAPAAPEVVVESVDAEQVVAAPAPAAVRAFRTPRAAIEPPARVEPVKANKALMRKEIKAKIRNLMEKSLKRLKAVPGVEVLLLENGEPLAVGIPSSLIFQSGLSFMKSASPILDSLTSLAFSLSGTQIVILPEGAAVGDAKIQDMRRTMGVSSQFFSAGIAPARVRVNLLNNQVEIPRPLLDFKGIVILFVHNQPLNLTVESSMSDEAGPPLSLGIFPETFSPGKSEGVIIEFSVQDPPEGLASWEFKLLQPSGADGGDLVPLQQVVGGGPVFHQIYWNGRQNYFGQVLPAGRYECVLTGTDAKNRQRTIHRWIALEAPAAAPRPRTPAQAVSAQAAPAAELPAELAQDAAPLIKRGQTPQSRKVKKRKAARMRRKKQVLRKDSERAAAKASVQEVLFQKDTHEMAPGGEKTLAQVAQTLSYYPLENLDVVGYAHSAEPDAAELAQKRAQVAAGMLINKHKVDPKKLQVRSSVSETPVYKVEIRFSGDSK